MLPKYYSVYLMFWVLDEFNEWLQASVHPDKVSTLFFFGKTIDGAGTKHFQLRTLGVLKICE